MNTSLQDLLKNLLVALTNIVDAKGIKIQSQEINPFNFQQHNLDYNSSPSYFGYISSQGLWFISKNGSNSNRYAGGKSGYQAAWNNRANLSYGYFNEINFQ